MKVFAPSYYNDFKCIASKCKNNCCIGWEIDIDENTLAFYKTEQDIYEKISFDDAPHFILGENDRCPFLNQNNLCEIIKNYGEDKLCQICSDHPRFRSFFDSRTEIGLGLTCEAAAKLILDNDFSLCLLCEDDEEEFENAEEIKFYEERDKIFQSDFAALSHLLPDIKLNDLAEFLFSLERLDKKWDECLLSIINSSKSIKEIEIPDTTRAKRLLSYFVFRHYHEYSLPFCLLCTYIIFAIDQDIYETARMFSSEIEYSDENMDKLSEFIEE